MEINLVSVMGTDPILSHHFIKYYKSLGIENFYIVLWGDSNKAPYREVIEVVKSHDINYTLIFYLDEKKTEMNWDWEWKLKLKAKIKE